MKNARTLFLLLSIVWCKQSHSGVPYHLSIPPENTSTKEILLPFAYRSLTAQEKSKLMYVPELRYMVLEEGKTECAIVGPLQPCKLVALQDSKTNKAIIFHKNDGNSSEKLCAIAQDNFRKNIKPEDIRGFIFSVSSPEVDKKYAWHKILGFHPTQKLKINYIKNVLVNWFKIKDHEQIQAQIFHTKNELFDPYAFLGHLYVLIDNKLNKNSICPIQENIFNIPHLETSSPEKQQEIYMNKYFKKCSPEKILRHFKIKGPTYEELGFFPAENNT